MTWSARAGLRTTILEVSRRILYPDIKDVILTTFSENIQSLRLSPDDYPKCQAAR